MDAADGDALKASQRAILTVREIEAPAAQAKKQSAAHISHGDVGNEDVPEEGPIDGGDGNATEARIMHDAIRDGNILKTADRLRAEFDPIAVALQDTIGDRDVSARGGRRALQRQRIVPTIKAAVRHANTGAAIQIDSVIVAIGVAVHRDAGDQNIVAAQVMLQPSRGIAQLQVADANSPATNKAQEHRAVAFHAEPSSIDASRAGDRDILGIMRYDERTSSIAPHGIAKSFHRWRIIRGIPAAQKLGPGLQVQLHATFQK